MIGYFKNAMSYNAVLAPVAATRDALSKRLESISDTVAHYYNKARGQEVPRETLKDIVEKQGYVGIEDIKHLYGREKNEAADNGLEDAQYLYDVHDMHLLEDGRRVKTWRITKNLNQSLADMIMWKAAPDINMRTKVVYSFECEVHRGGGEVGSHYKTKGSIGTLASLKEIENFIEECERQRLNLDDHEFWSKAYLPTSKTIKTPRLIWRESCLYACTNQANYNKWTSTGMRTFARLAAKKTLYLCPWWQERTHR